MRAIHNKHLFVFVGLVIVSVIVGTVFFVIREEGEQDRERIEVTEPSSQNEDQVVSDQKLIDLNVFDIQFDQDFDTISYFGTEEVMNEEIFFQIIGGGILRPIIGYNETKGLLYPIGYSRSRNKLRTFWGSYGQSGEGDQYTPQGLLESLQPDVSKHVISIDQVYLLEEKGRTPKKGLRGSFLDMIFVVVGDDIGVNYVLDLAGQVGVEVVYNTLDYRYTLWTPTQTREEILEFIEKVRLLSDQRIEVVDRNFWAVEITIDF